MAQVNSIKKSVMKAAWAVFRSKNNKESFGTCLRKAWKAIKAKMLMFAHKVHIRYVKADGTIRDAWATLGKSNFSYESKNSNRKHCFSTVVYFDLGKNAFRSFSIDSFLGVIEVK